MLIIVFLAVFSDVPVILTNIINVSFPVINDCPKGHLRSCTWKMWCNL